MEELNSLIVNFDNEHNKYKFKKCVQKNIILFGRTRSGKTTIANVIEDLKYIPDTLKLYSQTKGIEFHTIVSLSEYNKILYDFTLIDTPGFYEIGANNEIKLSNDDIKRLIDQCMIAEKTQIHAFAFVFSLESGVNREDIYAMLYVQEHYPQITPFAALIITHCEEMDQDERDQLTNDFFQTDEVVKNNLKDFFGLGVYYMGCLRPQSIKKRNHQAVKDQLEAVNEMRKTFIDFLISRETFFNIHLDKTTLEKQQQKQNELNAYLLEYQKEQMKKETEARQHILTQEENNTQRIKEMQARMAKMQKDIDTKCIIS